MIQGLTALPFLYIGFETRRRNLLNNIKLRKWEVLLIILWFISTFFGWLDIAQVRWNLYYVPNVILATSGTFFCYLISRYICQYFFAAKNILAFLGKYSIVL